MSEPKEIMATPGDCITSIAEKAGWSDPKRLWDALENKDLRTKRGSGNLLYPGDVVKVPTKPKEVSLPTGKIHKLVVKKPAKRRLRLALQNPDGTPLGARPFELKYGKELVKKSLDAQGLLEVELPPDVTEATLTVGTWKRTLMIGHLPPMKDTPDDGASGAEKRLINLGYYPGPPDGNVTPATEEALKQYQAAHKVNVTSKIDDDTKTSLEKVHGC